MYLFSIFQLMMAYISSKWCLSLLCFGFWFATVLAQTNTYPSSFSEDELLFNTNKDSGVTYNNSTLNKGRSIKCVPMIKLFEVELNEPLQAGEGVGLTGDHQKLGEWQIDKSLEMKRKRRNPLKWFLKIPMCTALRIYYRYFIYYKDSTGFKRMREWEGQQHSRVLEAYEIFRHQGSQKFGQAHALAFGGGVQRERSWLRQEYILQLKFIWPQHIRFTEFSHFIRKPRYVLKLEAFKDDDQQLEKLKPNQQMDIEMQVTRFMAKRSHLRALEQQGEFYRPGAILIFHITLSKGQEYLYILSIYTRQQELLGEVLIPAKVLERSEGILELPILDPQEQIRVGWLTLPYLRIEAMPQALEFNMRSSFHHYWPFNWPTLDIGSRGVGKSFYYHSANEVENTLKSFLKAENQLSDMIQLNVQLTRDYKPVVWHDYGFYTASPNGRRKLKAKDLEYVFLHDLTYEELLKKRVFMFVKGLIIELTHLNSPYVPESERIFPLLSEIYEHLPNTLGIMVDIKWPQLLSSGTFESLQSLDKNLYVNAVLKTTIDYGCGRPLIMVSFDADICTMVRYKQHMFPAVFLSMGQNGPWVSYADLRTHSLSQSLQFAQASDILGIAVYAKEILAASNNEQLQMAFDIQKLLFAWGDQLNDTSVLDVFRNQELAGLIYDQLDLFMDQRPKQKRKRFSFFEAEELQRIFLRQCIAAGNTSISEGLPDTHSPFWPRVRSLDEL